MPKEQVHKIIPINIEEEMKKSYIDYAMSVIVGRALPDVRDGLKPVHRRILYSMYINGITPDKPHKKSAHVVGDVMARYHPHGDAAIYEAMVRLAQPFSTRYPLIDGHGNFGSVDGDPAAAMRYTEARLTKISMELLADIDKDTVDFIPNYDETTKEPVVLPSRFPNILVNGSGGIAVGMATNIPPHNLTEVINALVALVDNPDLTSKELMLHIKGPDFPTGGIIMGRENLFKIYEKGRGTVKVRSKVDIEEAGSGKSRIVVTEIPYQVNKARLIERIAALVREKKLEGISDLRDESDRRGMRIVIELRRDVNSRVVLNNLYKHTQLEESFGVILLAIVKGKPQILTLKEILVLYLEHQQEIITRRTQYLLQKTEARAHIVEGLRIALAHLDDVIATIKASRDMQSAQNSLMDKFSLSERQARAILEMRLHRLTALERESLENEYRKLLDKVTYYRKILADEKLILKIIKEEFLEIKNKYGDPRKTQISKVEENLEEEDFIVEEEAVITITHRGYIKRIPSTTYRSQKRGGRGITAHASREGDFVKHLFVATTHYYLLFFTNKGKVYRLKVHEIPEASRQAKGIPLINLIYLDQKEFVTAVIPVRDFSKKEFLLMGTKFGRVKKTHLREYDSSRRDGIIAINLEQGDELIGVQLTSGKEEVQISTKLGMSIRFSEEQVRHMGRTAIGVKGITLKDEDEVIGIEKITPNTEVLVVTDKGYGKRTSIDEYRLQSRGGKGILAMKLSERNGFLVAAIIVNDSDEVMIITRKGIIIRISAKSVPSMRRTTQGVRLMRLDDEDKVVAVAKVSAKDKGEA